MVNRTDIDDSGVPAQLREELEALQSSNGMEDGNTAIPAPEAPDIVDPMIPTPDTMNANSPSADPVTSEPTPDHKPTPAPAPEPTSVTPSPLDGTPEGFVKKATHDVLQGKYNAETKALREDVAMQRQRADRLESENEVLKQQVQAIQEQMENETADPDNPYGLPDDLKDMPEVIEIAERVSQKGQQQMKAIQDKMDAYEQQVAKDKEATFWQSVDQLIPNWQEINEDESFLAYLDESMPELGITRSDLLQDARNERDANRVKAIFDTYLARQAGNMPVVPNVASQVVPTAQANAGTQKTSEIIPASEVSELYDRIIAGQFRDPQEREYQEKRIQDAMRENRVDYER